MDNNTPLFPFRAVMSGELRGTSVDELIDQAGDPYAREGDILIYDFNRSPDPTAVADPKEVVVQFWVVDGLLSNCHLHLKFLDGMEYDELLW